MKNNKCLTHEAGDILRISNTGKGGGIVILRCILALAATLPLAARAQLAPDTARAIDAIAPPG